MWKKEIAIPNREDIASGLEPFIPPEPLPPIKEEEIELLVWMGITVDE